MLMMGRGRRQAERKCDAPQFAADGVAGAIWRGLMCPLARALVKSAVTKPGRSRGVSTRERSDSRGVDGPACVCVFL